MKKIILIIFLFFIYNCGYTSVYKNLEKKDFEIIIVKMKGDRVMNNLIQNEINMYSNKNNTYTTTFNIFFFKFIEKYSKKVSFKNASNKLSKMSSVKSLNIRYSKKRKL